MLNVLRYYHTLRYLRPIQFYARLWHRFYRPSPDLRSAPALRPHCGAWRKPAQKQPSLIAANRFRFLNEEHDLVAASDWNHPVRAKLWSYNLHYFDDLNAELANDRRAWHVALIERWIAENLPGRGNGWEPYPLSMRIVNWIKWALAGNCLSDGALHSLAVQARYLAGRIEYHLLGNHLLANAKALVFAGIFFNGNEAASWLKKGLRLLNTQLPEQILSDGGHFERSPMYHCIIFEDLLDLINLLDGHGTQADVSLLKTYAGRMLRWMEFMRHPDGQIALLNDAALGIAAHPGTLTLYAEALGVCETDEEHSSSSAIERHNISCISSDPIRLIHLKASGYIRVENGPMILFLDVAPIGPDYLPGHAHADTLTFEMSLHGQRFIVDSGTSRYDEGLERLRERSTKSHNTVVIDGQDSSEVWGGFRVARRARPFGLEIKETAPGYLTVRCAHDGYRRLPGRPIHWREWCVQGNSLTIRDVIEGRYDSAEGYFHFYPSVKIENEASDSNGHFFSITLKGSKRINCCVQKGHSCMVSSAYHQEFGMSIPNQCLEVELNNDVSHLSFSWS